MPLLITGAFLAFAAMGPLAPSSAPAVQDSVIVAHVFDDGDHDHNGSQPPNEDPVTNSGRNKGTSELEDALNASEDNN